MQQKLPSVQAIQTAISIKASVRKESAAATTAMCLIMRGVTHFVGKVKKIGEWCFLMMDKCESGSKCSEHHMVCVRENTTSTAPAPGEPCASNSDCDYDGGVCLKFDSCKLGFCLCDVGLEVSYRRRACAKPIKIGEPCVPHDECIVYSANCKNNVCSCEDHGSTPSDDKTRCYRKHGETCNSQSDCHMKCLNAKNATLNNVATQTTTATINAQTTTATINATTPNRSVAPLGISPLPLSRPPHPHPYPARSSAQQQKSTVA
ncbi:hypothetical protein LSAT2_009193 [Lamellibrachia satsuma]|nr:hypothetical protein LSAT2_009193 [Lamellibrachia satsuma]